LIPWLALAVVPAAASPILAAELPAEAAGDNFNTMIAVYWAVAFAGSLAALFFAWHFFKAMMASDPGNAEMVEIAGYVRTGANAYLRQQYKVVFMFFVVIFILLALAAFWAEVQRFVVVYRLSLHSSGSGWMLRAMTCGSPSFPCPLTPPRTCCSSCSASSSTTRRG